MNFIIRLGIVFIVIILIAILNPIQLSPKNNFETTSREITFGFSGTVNKLILDTNKEFSSPKIFNIKENELTLNLEPNTYYWKLKGIKESGVKKFTITSEVALNLIKDDQSVEVKNTGNTDLNLEVQSRDTSTITGFTILNYNSSIKEKEGNITIIGSQR